MGTGAGVGAGVTTVGAGVATVGAGVTLAPVVGAGEVVGAGDVVALAAAVGATVGAGETVLLDEAVGAGDKVLLLAVLLGAGLWVSRLTVGVASKLLLSSS